ncbi:MAG: hypothetical protein M3Z26_16940 [Bacteroidota bacterium]|nr:hypothetical protein [Bacteroidota bacterium]
MKPDYSKPITRHDANTVINNRLKLIKELQDLKEEKKDFIEAEKFFTNPLNSFIFSRRRLDELFCQKSDSDENMDCIVAILGAEYEIDPTTKSSVAVPTIVLAACHSSQGKSEGKYTNIHLVTPNSAFPATETPPKQTLHKLPDPS